MRFSAVLALASVAIASPIAIEERQYVLGSSASEFTSGGCRDVIFIFARGSTEAGNMGSTVGPDVANRLKTRIGLRNVAAEGVPYAAALATNYLPGGTDSASKNLMKNLFIQAATQCPNSRIVAGGYSQGGAVVHRSVEELTDTVRNKIKAIVLFGDTQKLADGNRVPTYNGPTKFYCANGLDQVCNGVLSAAVLVPHLSYGLVAEEAGDWLADQL